MASLAVPSMCPVFMSCEGKQQKLQLYFERTAVMLDIKNRKCAQSQINKVNIHCVYVQSEH